jgi:hypothetical protein
MAVAEGNMIIRIPRVVTTAWDGFGEWANVPIYKLGRFEVRRLDVLLLLAGVFCVGYYWWTTDWHGALLGGAMYVLMLMMALWLL